MNMFRPASAPVLLFFAFAGFAFALDQGTKAWASAALAGGRDIVVVKNFFSFTLAHNDGGAFGMFSGWSGPWQIVVLLALPSLATLLFTVYFFLYERGNAVAAGAFGLIVGGALGNLLDRASLGYVVDFLDAHWMHRAHWPTFNIADSAVTVGASLLVIDYLRAWREERNSETV